MRAVQLRAVIIQALWISRASLRARTSRVRMLGHNNIVSLHSNMETKNIQLLDREQQDKRSGAPWKNFKKPKSSLFLSPFLLISFFFLPSFNLLEFLPVCLLLPLLPSFRNRSPRTCTLISWLTHTNLSTTIFYTFLLLSMRATCSAHPDHIIRRVDLQIMNHLN